MSSETESLTLEDQIYEVSELIENYVNEFVEKEHTFDPIKDRITDFTKFEDINIADGINIEKDLVLELSSSRVLANFISLKTSENGHNLRQIATLVDLCFYFKEINESRYDLPHLLLTVIIKETPVDWLLKFWRFFELREELIKIGKDSELLQAHKFPGSALIIALNARLKQFEHNNEPDREILKAKILILTSKIFPISDRYLINRKFDTNKERSNELIFKKTIRRSKFNAFWRLQPILASPFERLSSDNAVQDFLQYIEEVYNFIFEIETEKHGTLEGSRTKLPRDSYNNTLQHYTRANLTESKREELREFYSKREFNPSFFITEQKFEEQVTKDDNLRRVVLLQLLTFSCWVINLYDSAELNTNHKYANHKLRRFSKLVKPAPFDRLKKEINFIFQSVDKRVFFANQQISVSDAAFLQLKLTQFKDFQKVYEPFKLDDALLSKLEDFGKFRGKHFHEYGTPPISRHWKTSTGLDSLVKDEAKGTPEQINQELESLRNSIKSSNDEGVKNLNSWKALRLARKNNLFKFKQVNESTGLEGLFDASLKEEYEKTRKEQEEKREKEEEERLETLKTEQKAAELKQEEERQELERKRKASEEEFAEQSKRAKLESANGTKDSEDLDY